jgi:hypothetical protein
MLLFAACAAAQRADSARVVAGPEYRAGAVRRLFDGGNYRALWTAPVSIPVLDPDSFAGGLTVQKEGGGLSTESLRMTGRNGREFVFRSVDKNVTPSIPADLRGALPHDVVQDLVSAKHPGAALIVAPLLEPVGVLHATPRLYVMPDAPFLGDQRARFRGRLGTVEERPGDGFAGAKDVQGSDDFRKLIEASPRDRVDAQAFLTARLMDLVVGDWDRHWDQWRWARFDSPGVRWWKPIPRDRDNAFNDNHGLVTTIARPVTPIMVHFGPTFDQLIRYENQPAELDRLLLTSLPRAAWDSTVSWVRARLTDEVIEAAVRSVPPPWNATEGERLVADLEGRRDHLPDIADQLYRLLAREPEVHATDESDVAELARLPGGSVDVTLRSAGGAAYFHRTFLPGETREVRVFLHGGADRATVTRQQPGGILVRVIGGGGDDTLVNESARAGGRRTVFYDDRGDNRIDPGREAKVDTRPWSPPKPTTLLGNPPPPRDWGASMSMASPYANWELNVGPVIGAGPAWTRYGFRRTPHAETVSLQALWAPLERSGFGAQLHYDRQITNRPAFVWLKARGSHFEDVRFHGYGNQTPADPGKDVFEVEQTQLRAQAAYEIRPSPSLRLYAGPAAKWTSPRAVRAVTTGVLGNERFWQAGAVAGAELDLRDSAADPRSGARARVTTSGYGTSLWGPFGRTDGEAAAYLSVPGRVGPTLAVRAGGAKAYGRFPFQESAPLGGPFDVRGYAYQRYRGDAAVYGSAELRARLAYLNLGLARAHVGAFALADAGRVYVGGGSPGGWHTGVGGGLSLKTLGRTGTVAYARGERGIVYVTLGMPF